MIVNSVLYLYYLLAVAEAYKSDEEKITPPITR